MVIITAEEKKIIAEKMPNVHIHRTVKQKTRRHRYYMEEDRNALRLLKELRNPK